MTKEYLMGAECGPSLFACDANSAEHDRFSILDGLGSDASSCRHGTRWLRAVPIGVAIVVVGVGCGVVGSALVASGAKIQRAFASQTAVTLPMPSKTPLIDAAQPGSAYASSGGERGGEKPGGAARIISASSDDHRLAGQAAADGYPRRLETETPTALFLNSRAAPPQMAPRVLSSARVASGPQPQGGSVVSQPRRNDRPAAPRKPVRDPDVDIITAIVEHAGRRR